MQLYPHQHLPGLCRVPDKCPDPLALPKQLPDNTPADTASCTSHKYPGPGPSTLAVGIGALAIRCRLAKVFMLSQSLDADASRLVSPSQRVADTSYL